MKGQISEKDCFDKIYGGWFGKCLGGVCGAKLEGFKRANPVRDLSDYIDLTVANDDLDIQLLWLDAIEDAGLENINSILLAKYWLERCWYPFSEYGIFLKNFERGILPPESGRFNNDFFSSGMGCAIRSEIWAFTSIGNIGGAVANAEKDAVLDHSGDGVYAEVFLTALEAYAFFESDLRKLICLGLDRIDKDCKLYACIQTALRCYDGGMAVEKAREAVLRGFGHPDFTNCVQNIGFTILALLYGGGDMRATVNTALFLGYDTDCTAASAAAVVGIISGYAAVDGDLKALVGDTFVCGVDARPRGNSILQLAKDTLKINSFKDGGIFLQEDGKRLKSGNTIEWAVEYADGPFIGGTRTVAVKLVVKNNRGAELSGKLTVGGSPAFKIGYPGGIKAAPFGKAETRIGIYLKDGEKLLQNKNMFRVRLTEDCGNLHEFEFGLAGANIWRLYGSYTDALIKEQDPGQPPCHGEGSILPSLECMVNNYVELGKTYIDESSLNNKMPYDGVIWSGEDRINVEKAIGCQGQCAVYLVQEIDYPREEKVWAVIGNNDAFVLYVNGKEVMRRDEMRMWTPYNNGTLIDLKKGKNTVALKLLRRGDALNISFGLRKYEGEHWHRKKWIVDHASVIPDKN